MGNLYVVFETVVNRWLKNGEWKINKNWNEIYKIIPMSIYVKALICNIYVTYIYCWLIIIKLNM